MVSNNVRVLETVFRAEEQLLEEIKGVVSQYYGRLSYAQLLGVLEILKSEYMKDFHILGPSI